MRFPKKAAADLYPADLYPVVLLATNPARRTATTTADCQPGPACRPPCAGASPPTLSVPPASSSKKGRRSLLRWAPLPQAPVPAHRAAGPPPKRPREP